jgi:hypothetical protein
VAAQVQTCAVHTETGDRAWFPTAQLPEGYVSTTPMGNVRSCCTPRECNSTVARHHNDGCTWRVGDACVVLQFRGEVPTDMAGALAWAEAFFAEILATLIDAAGDLGIDLSELRNVKLSDFITVVSGPNPNNATGTYYTTIQVKPFSLTVPLSPEQLLAAITGAINNGHHNNVGATQVVSQLQGVASFTQFTADGTEDPLPRGTASAADGLHASIVLVLATGLVATVVAKVAAFMQ